MSELALHDPVVHGNGNLAMHVLRGRVATYNFTHRWRQFLNKSPGPVSLSWLKTKKNFHPDPKQFKPGTFFNRVKIHVNKICCGVVACIFSCDQIQLDSYRLPASFRMRKDCTWLRTDAFFSSVVEPEPAEPKLFRDLEPGPKLSF